MEEFFPLTFHQSAWQPRLIKSLQDNLQKGQIPNWWMYRSTNQSACWQEYSTHYSPWNLQREKLLQMYRDACIWISRMVADRPVQVISLGPGDGTKDGMLMKILLDGGVRKPSDMIYTPLDISAELCIRATNRVKSLVPDIITKPLVVQIEQYPRLRPWWMRHEAQSNVLGRAIRIITCFGIIPNMDVAPFLDWLKRMMRPSDWLLISVNLSPPITEAIPLIMPQYDNSLARAWYKSGLDSLGIGRQRVSMNIHPEALNEDGSAWRVCLSLSSLNAKRSLKITPFSSEIIELELENPLRLFFSNRFESETFSFLMRQQGLSTSKQWLEEKKCWEGIFASRIIPTGTKEIAPILPDLKSSSRSN